MGEYLKKIKDLQPGEYFIWGDETTREYMCWWKEYGVAVDGISTIMRCSDSRADTDYSDGTSLLQFEYYDPTGDVWELQSLWYEDYHIVAVVPVENGYSRYLPWDYDTICAKCGRRFGNHWGGISDHKGPYAPDSEDTHTVAAWWCLYKEPLRSHFAPNFVFTGDYWEDLGL